MLDGQTLHAHATLVAEHDVVRAAAEARQVEHRVALKGHVLLCPNHTARAVHDLDCHPAVEAGNRQGHLTRGGVGEHAEGDAVLSHTVFHLAHTITVLVDGVVDGVFVSVVASVPNEDA